MTAQQLNHGANWSALLALLLGLLGGIFLSHFAEEAVHEHEDPLVVSRLSDLPHGIFSLLEYSDSQLQDLQSISLVFEDSDETLEAPIDGFDRVFVEAQDENMTLASVNLYLHNEEYHTVSSRSCFVL